MNETCTDNRFEVIAAYKKKLKERTNIETSPDEMAVIDHVLFRFWQMGWLPPVPHGRLGDLDRILEIIDGIWDCNDMTFKPNDHCCDVPKDCHGCKWAETKRAIREIVANAPTIIPADRREREV